MTELVQSFVLWALTGAFIETSTSAVPQNVGQATVNLRFNDTR